MGEFDPDSILEDHIQGEQHVCDLLGRVSTLHQSSALSLQFQSHFSRRMRQKLAQRGYSCPLCNEELSLERQYRFNSQVRMLSILAKGDNQNFLELSMASQ